MDFIFNVLENVKEANVLLQSAAVFVVSMIPFLEGYVAAPIGVMLGISPIPVIAAALIGNWLSIMLIIVLHGKWSSGRQGMRSGKRMERARKIFGKYGVPGVALIGPLVFGHHIGAFISLVSGAPKGYVTLWQTIAVAV
ncbi:small multi-drug export protein [Paenibacillus thiaminolyticus]|uniref:Small multi-drug export protein n=1 Tax=Paenibacillus thiaminolyticus TaxID=49283 RepID=A0AAP9DZQ0_PANTH|nr:small multi-drug export protein [Paenibacillus thiaminolyticus]MCY9534369.1 small multi-drug export protein [Paenibacillus thiaminolyticus]MCY9602897.1 small multi-drug export protein [Paenibacillus thiaminolyticus]MCY9608311.1 small multi-drug export protein [Paenibacillus thiaminolyticus]MCY9614404.1 small multi-drug export protein [Paenibacillus thiaminolyticus]MCY9618193.1 small multi-drug export protein [Paenibacillus thiaminolyticus]